VKLLLRTCLESGLSPESGRTLPSWHEHHGTAAIPERPDGPPVGQHRAPVPAGPRPHRPAPDVSGTGGRERHPGSGPWRVYLADAAARLPALEDGLVLLLHLAGRRGVGAGPRRPPGRGPWAGRAGADAECRHPRQPDGEDDRGRRPEGVRRGEKRSPAASGTGGWTPSG
jgi:hypothetical protein